MNRFFTTLFCCLTLSTAYSQTLAGYRQAPGENAHNYTVSHKKTDTLPSSYDSRDYGYITQSRNQEISGTCWAFATCDVLEALSNKLGFNDGYYSPQLLSNCHTGFDWTKQQGGNSNISTAMLTNCEGPAYEARIPYAAAEEDCMEHSPEDYPAYFLGAYELPSDDINAIKECIYEYGSVMASMHVNSSSYNAETNTYCYTGDEPANHAVSLIGWDDSKSAFISKFNYGATRFVNGCMYISYNDKLITKACTSFHSRVEKSEIDTAYYYDKTSALSYLDFTGIAKTISVLSYFDGATGDTLTRVGAYVWDPESEIKFTIMVGTNVYEKSIYCKYTGFYSTELDNEIVLDGQFLVAVDYPSIHIPIETKYNGYNEPTFLPSGKQFYQINGQDPNIPIGTDTYYSNINFCIKAYSKHPVIPTAVQQTAESGTAVVIDGKINTEIWQTATEIEVLSLDGTPKAHLTAGNSVDLKGIYIFAVRYSNGVKRSIELLY